MRVLSSEKKMAPCFSRGRRGLCLSQVTAVSPVSDGLVSSRRRAWAGNTMGRIKKNGAAGCPYGAVCLVQPTRDDCVTRQWRDRDLLDARYGGRTVHLDVNRVSVEPQIRPSGHVEGDGLLSG